MKFLNKCERKFGKYAIRNLMKYVTGLYILGFLINLVDPLFYTTYLMLDIDKVLHGQVWRLVTFLIQPIGDTSFNMVSILFLIISLYLYYMIGNALENAWGSFRFNLYFISGILFNVLAVVVFYLVVGVSYPVSISYINQSMFFAFAALYPNLQFRIYFLIPVKAKYLAWLYGAIIGYEVIRSFWLGIEGNRLYLCQAVSLVLSMANFLIFFLLTRNYRRISPADIKRRHEYRRSYNEGKRTGNVVSFEGRTVLTRHKCAICGKTEVDDDMMEFRFCSKCNGNYEYCSEHLYTHEHVK